MTAPASSSVSVEREDAPVGPDDWLALAGPALYAKAHRGATMPAVLRDRLTVAELAGWLMGDALPANERDRLVAAARQHVDALVFAALDAAAGDDAGSRSGDSGWQRAGMAADYACWLIDGERAAWRAADSAEALLVEGLEGMHALWRPQYLDALGSGLKGPLHPLGPLVKDWINAQRPVRGGDTRRLNIFSGPTGAPRDAERLLLPESPGPAGPAPLSDGLMLPGLEPPESLAGVVRPMLVHPYDDSRLRSRTRGRGATLLERAVVFGLLSLPPDARRDAASGLAVSVELAPADWVRDFWPHGRHKGQRGRLLFDDLQRALWGLGSVTLRYRAPDAPPDVEPGHWSPVVARYVPSDWRDKIVYDVRLPPGSAGGFLVDRHQLRAHGVHSAPVFRAYLALRQYFDRFGGVNGMLTRAFAPDGSRLPNADRYPVIPDVDLWALAFQSLADADQRDEGRRLRGAAAVRHVLTILEAAGDVVIEETHDAEGRPGVRLLPPAAKTAERNALGHDLRRRRRENQRAQKSRS